MINDVNGGSLTLAGFEGAQLTQELTQGFFKGRTYRAYKEFTANTVLKLVATKPFLLTSQALYVDAGQARALITVGSTEGGTFTTLPTKFAKNGTVASPPAPTTTISQGGTATGGTEREVLRVNAGGGAQALNSLGGIRKLPAGTYYISITVTGTTSGIYSIEYEELDF